MELFCSLCATSFIDYLEDFNLERHKILLREDPYEIGHRYFQHQIINSDSFSSETTAVLNLCVHCLDQLYKKVLGLISLTKCTILKTFFLLKNYICIHVLIYMYILFTYMHFTHTHILLRIFKPNTSVLCLHYCSLLIK